MEAACKGLEKAYPQAKANWGDGLRLDWEDRWVQVRASNTEPIIRIIAEAPGEEVAQKLCAEAVKIVRNLV